MNRLILCFALYVAALAAQTGKPHPFRGKVTQVDPSRKSLTVQNQPIEGWMGAMTMGYTVANPAIFESLHPGDEITGTVYDGDTRNLYNVALVPSGTAQTTLTALRLQDLEAMALAAHPALAQAEAAREVAKGMARQASLYPNPTVGYYGDEIRGGHSGGGKQGVFASQTLVMGGKLAAARRLGDREIDQASASLSVQRNRVLLDVRTSWYHALTTQRLLELRQRQAELAADAAQTASQLANTGIADHPDVLQAEIEQHQARLAVRNAEQELRSAWRSLAIAAGNPDLPETNLSDDLDNAPTLIYEELLAQALRASPEILLAQTALNRAEANQNYARRVPVPDLTFSATLANNFEPLEPASRPTGLQGGAQIGLQIPLFNRNQGNIAAAGAEIETARAALGRQKLEVQRQLAALFQEYEMARETALQYRTEILPRATQAYRQYQSNYQEMAGSYTPVLMAQRSLFQLELERLHALEMAWCSALGLKSLANTLQTGPSN